MRIRRVLLPAALFFILTGLAILAVRLWPRPMYSPEPPITWAEPDCAETLAQPGRDLPFELFEQGYSFSYDKEFSEPRLYLLNSAADVSNVQGLLRSPTLEGLAKVDFGQYAVLVALDGIKGHSGSGIAIERIYQTGSSLVVGTRHWGGPPNGETELVMNHPYDIVLVPRDGPVFDDLVPVFCTRLVPHPTREPRKRE